MTEKIPGECRERQPPFWPGLVILLGGAVFSFGSTVMIVSRLVPKIAPRGEAGATVLMWARGLSALLTLLLTIMGTSLIARCALRRRGLTLGKLFVFGLVAWQLFGFARFAVVFPHERSLWVGSIRSWEKKQHPWVTFQRDYLRSDDRLSRNRSVWFGPTNVSRYRAAHCSLAPALSPQVPVESPGVRIAPDGRSVDWDLSDAMEPSERVYLQSGPEVGPVRWTFITSPQRNGWLIICRVAWQPKVNFDSCHAWFMVSWYRQEGSRWLNMTHDSLRMKSWECPQALYPGERQTSNGDVGWPLGHLGAREVNFEVVTRANPLPVRVAYPVRFGASLMIDGETPDLGKLMQTRWQRKDGSWTTREEAVFHLGAIYDSPLITLGNNDR